jgi:muconate cycloisomerase
MSCVVPVSTPEEALPPKQVAGIYYRDDLIADAFAFKDGAIAVPDAPGLGWAVDLAKIERYRLRATTRPA